MCLTNTVCAFRNEKSFKKLLSFNLQTREQYSANSFSLSLLSTATILIGVILSLIIVCVLDLVFPTKMDATRYQRLHSDDDETTRRKSRSSKQAGDLDEEPAKEEADEEKKEL